MTTIQNINVGSSPNDGTGDPLRTAFTKTNSNFSSLAPFASGVNLVIKNSNYTFLKTDAGNEFGHTDSSNYTWTIDTFANNPIGAGQKISGFCSGTGIITITGPAGGSLTRLDGIAGTGNRTVGANSYFVLHKLDNADSWGITGTLLI